MLVEVLLSLSLVLFLFEWSFLQIAQGRAIKSAYYRSIATIQLQSLAERLRADRAGALSLEEREEWNRQNAELLPRGMGDYSCQMTTGAAYRCVLQIHWFQTEKRALSLTMLL